MGFSPFQFDFKSSEDGSTLRLLDYSTSQPFTTNRMVKIVEIRDSIYRFFPSLELIVDDGSGYVLDKLQMAEGAQFSTKFYSENDTKNVLENDYIWSEYQCIEAKVADYVAGRNILILLDKRFMKDVKESKVFPSMPSSAVASMIATGVFGMLPTVKPFMNNVMNLTDAKGGSHLGINVPVPPTVDVRTWYQFNQSTSGFLKSLAKGALHPTYPSSPFVTFINCRGEFYFQTIAELFLQLPVRTYEIKMSAEVQEDARVVKGYQVFYNGAQNNKDNYSVRYFHNESDTGKSKKNDLERIDNHIPMGLGTVLVPNDVINRGELPRGFWNYRNLGLFNYTEQSLKEGIINNDFLKSNLTYQWSLTVAFDPNLAAGKIVELNVPSSDTIRKNRKCSELSGKWLILECIHHMDFNYKPTSILRIAKPGMIPGSDHALPDNSVSPSALLKGTDVAKNI